MIHPRHEDDRLRMRRARPSDAQALTVLALGSKRSNGYDDAFMTACQKELTVTPRDIEADEYWLVEDESIHGFAALRCDIDAQFGEVHAFFVAPNRQRTGIGQRLWRRLLERALALGLGELRLDADPAAVPFYSALGFEKIGEVASGSIPGRTIPRMRKRLGTSTRSS